MVLMGLASSCMAAARPAWCGGVPEPGFDQPPNPAHTGRYTNSVYRYALTLPNGLTAHSSASGPERGIGVVLSWTPRAYLQVDAVYDVFYDISAENVHRRDLGTIRLHDRVVADQSQIWMLANSSGGRYLTDAQCRGDPQIYRHDDVIVMRNREIYRISLQTTPERYDQDVKLLNELLKSWRWVQ